MNRRPYPNVDRALRNLRHQQAVYKFGRMPIRYVIGLGQDVGDIRAMTEDEVATLQQSSFPVDTYRLSSRPGVVGGGQ